MKRRLGVVLLLLGISVAALPSFATRTQAIVLQPLQITKTTSEVNHAPQGGRIWYDIKICNPNDHWVDLNEITDTLPSGFSYETESTDGIVSFDPDISGRTLSWFIDGEESVEADSCIHLYFTARVSREEPPGVYCNQASVLWDESSANTGLTAPVQVTELQPETVQELTCTQAPPPPAIVRTATPTRTATPRASATATAAPPTKTAVSTVLAAEATPRTGVVVAAPNTGTGSSGNDGGTTSWLLAIAGTLLVGGAGLTLAGRKRA